MKAFKLITFGKMFLSPTFNFNSHAYMYLQRLTSPITLMEEKKVYIYAYNE